jgi:negative regulator of sigma E activity
MSEEDPVVSAESSERMEESASQLSAMFDGELSAAECELLSRRLARDEALRARWARYALVGAAMRAEPIATVSGGFARRVGAAIDRQETGASPAGAQGFRRLRTVALGGSLAAGVAAAAVFLLRNEVLRQDEALVAYTPSVQRQAAPPPAAYGSLRAAGSNGEPASYVVPPQAGGALQPVPVSLANYVVAHSEYSSPLARRGLLSALVASDSGQIVDQAPATVIVEDPAPVAASAAAR